MKTQHRRRFVYLAALLAWFAASGAQAEEVRRDDSGTTKPPSHIRPSAPEAMAPVVDDFFDERAPDCNNYSGCGITSDADCKWQNAPADPVEEHMAARGIVLDGSLEDVGGSGICVYLPCEAAPYPPFVGHPAVALIDRMPDLTPNDPGVDGDREQPRRRFDPSGFNTRCSFILFAPDSGAADGVDDSFLYLGWDISDDDAEFDGIPVPYDTDDNGNPCTSTEGTVRDYFTESYRVTLDACADFTDYNPCFFNTEYITDPRFSLEMLIDERTDHEPPLGTSFLTHGSLNLESAAFPTADGVTNPGNACIERELHYCAQGNNVELVIKGVETSGVFGPNRGQCGEVGEVGGDACTNDADCTGEDCFFRECEYANTLCIDDGDCPGAGEKCVTFVKPDSDEARQNRFALAELIAQLEGSTDGDFGDEEFASVPIHTSLPDIEVTKFVRCVEDENPDFFEPWDRWRHVHAWPGAEVEFEITITNYGNEDLAVTVMDVFEAVGSELAECELNCDFFEAFLISPRRGVGVAPDPPYEVTFANADQPDICADPDDYDCLNKYFFFPGCDPIVEPVSFLESIFDPAVPSAYLGTLLGADVAKNEEGVCAFTEGDTLIIHFRAFVDIEHVCENSGETCDDATDCDAGEDCVPNLDEFCAEFEDPDCKNSVKVEGAVLIPELGLPSTCIDNADCDDGLYCTGVETCNGTVCERGAPPCAIENGCFEDTQTCGTHGVGVDICGAIHACDAADIIDTEREWQNRICDQSDELCGDDYYDHTTCPEGAGHCLGKCSISGTECEFDADCPGNEKCNPYGVDDNVADIDLLCHGVSVTKEASCDEPRLPDLDLDPDAVWEPDCIEAIPGARVAFKIELCNIGEFNIPEVTIDDELLCPLDGEGPHDWYATGDPPYVIATIKDIDTDEIYDVTECICDDATHECLIIEDDMNGTKIFADCLALPVERRYIKPGECLVITFQVDVPEDYDKICEPPSPLNRAWGEDGSNNNCVNFALDAPAALNVVGNTGVQDFLSAGDFGPDTHKYMYVLKYGAPHNLYKMFMSDGHLELVGPAAPNSGQTWSGMVWDATTREMWAASTNLSVSELYTIDLDTGTPTFVGTMGTPGCIALAVDCEGNFYAYDIVNDDFGSVNPDTGAYSTIGAIGFDANFAQGMDYDGRNSVMYMAAFNNTTFQAELRTVNLATGATTLVGTLGTPGETDLGFVGIDGSADICGECTNEVTMSATGGGGEGVCGEAPPAGGSDDVGLDVLVPRIECEKLVCADFDVDGDCDTPWTSLLELDPDSFEFPILLHYKYTATNTGEVDLDPVDIGDPGLIEDIDATDDVEINEVFYPNDLDPLKNGGYKDCGRLEKGDPCCHPPIPGEQCTARIAVWIESPEAWEAFAVTDEDGNDDCYANVADTTGMPAPPPGVCVPDRPVRVHAECFASVCMTIVPPCRPVTKALFTIWNQNEHKFEGLSRCIFSWDEELLSRYVPSNTQSNYFDRYVLETDKGIAQIDGLRDAVVCTDESISAPLLGVSMKVLDFEDDRVGRSGIPLVAMGHEEGLIQYDPTAPSPPPELPGDGGGSPGSLGETVTDTGLAQLPGLTPAMMKMLAPELAQLELEPLADGRGDPVLASTSQKGSLLVFTKVELKWNPAGELIQDTFIDITNDWNYPVNVQLYMVRYCGEYVDNEIVLTGNEPTYWSAAQGGPKDVSPFTVLGDGFMDDDPHNFGGTKLHGYILAWAVDSVTNEEVRWNHLKGDALIVNYQDKTAWEYPAWAFKAQTGDFNGDTLINPPGELRLNGIEYDFAPAMLVLDFYATGTELGATGGAPQTAVVDTDLTLWAAIKDLRQH